MKRKAVPYRAAAGAALLAVAVTAHAEPTRLAAQELAAVAPANSISLDLEHGLAANGVTGGLRIGAFDGEVLLNVRNETSVDGAELGTTNIGYKTLIAPGLAAYGLLSYVNADLPGVVADSTTEIGLGIAYTLRQGPLTLNVNPELLTDEAGLRDGDTTIFVRGGALYALPVQASGRLSLLGEVTLENSDVLDTTINLGLRWAPRQDVTIDFVVFNDQGDNGDFQGIPGVLKVNIAF